MCKVLILIIMLFLSIPTLCFAAVDQRIPEPATIFLVGSGLAGMGALEMWRRIKSKR
jgi:hypothetical protein